MLGTRGGTNLTATAPLDITGGVISISAGGIGNSLLANQSITISGNSVSLGGSLSLDSADLSDISTLSILTSGTLSSTAGTSSFKQAFIGTISSAGVNITSPSDGNLTFQNNASSANANLTFKDAVMSGKITQYSGLTMAGFGVAGVVARGHSSGQTSAVASVCTFTPAADGTFEVCATAMITAFTSGALNVRVSYTDDNNVARTTDQLAFLNFAGGISSGPNSILSWRGIPCQIRVKGGTAITIFTNGTFSLTYDIEGIIKQVA